MKWFRLSMALIIGVFSVPARTSADNSSAFGCDRPIHLAFAEFGVLYHQGVGIDQDLIDEIARRTGCQFDTQVLPREQIERRLLNGALDMATGARATSNLRKSAYLVPYLGLKTVIVTTTGNATQIHSFDDVLARADWRIGVVAGLAYGAYYDYRLHGLHEQYRIITYPDQQTLYRGLRHDDVQVVLSQSVNYAFYLPLPGDQQDFVMFDAAPALPVAHALAFERDRFTPAMIDAWTRVIEEMRLDGTLEKIYQRRMPPTMAAQLLTY
jgi:polar amino acid transport system substrate-binding protein